MVYLPVIIAPLAVPLPKHPQLDVVGVQLDRPVTHFVGSGHRTLKDDCFQLLHKVRNDEV